MHINWFKDENHLVYINGETQLTELERTLHFPGLADAANELRRHPTAEGFTIKGPKRTSGRLFVPDLTFGEHIEMGENIFFYMGEMQECYVIYWLAAPVAQYAETGRPVGGGPFMSCAAVQSLAPVCTTLPMFHSSATRRADSRRSSGVRYSACAVSAPQSMQATETDQPCSSCMAPTPRQMGQSCNSISKIGSMYILLWVRLGSV